ncbi:hypothetical protein [Actinoplanes sp. NPDC051851]|uniref:hypothetical protein n=1 Tax=Actinoplanes sp. NPDC051851 TaxID=3154753 RepID=UPI00343956AC
MAHLTREQILARKLGRGTVTLPGGETVAIRALTRDEVLTMQEIDDLRERDNFIVATALTDPVLSIEDVAAWGAAGDAGDLAAITDEVAVLSRLKQGAGKSGVQGS